MDDLSQIFEPYETDDDPAAVLDRELTNTGQVLQKIAEAEGIDLDALPEQDLADLLTMLQGGEVSGGVENNFAEHQTKEASYEMSNENTLTVADVALELSKVAHANGIDLDAVSREEYAEAFDAMAQEMQDPAYFEKQAEMHEKLAEADAIGRYMAHAFIDELNGVDKEAAEVTEANLTAAERKAGLTPAQAARRRIKARRMSRGTGGGPTPPGGRRPHGPSGLARTEGEMGAKAEGFAKAREFSAPEGRTNFPEPKTRLQRAGAAIRGAGTKADTAVARGGEKLIGLFSKKPQSMTAARLAGYGAAGTLLAGGATAAALAKRHSDRKKAASDEALDVAFEEDASNYAVSLLMEQGLVEPVEIEFSKFAEFAGEEYNQLVEQRAWEILDEHGWLED